MVVAGGSISGLLAAREIGKSGYSVLVLEEGFEVGTPDHCGGLVSKSALHGLGIEPSQKTFDCMINSAEIYSPTGKKIGINSKNQEVIVVNRRELDKQAAYQAQQSGVEIMVKTSFKEKTGQVIQTSAGEIKCKILVDCRGVGRLVNANRDGILLSAQHEVYADCDIIIAGDAAGQSKPTTAGGIYSCGMGGIIAGNAITKYFETGMVSELEQYQKSWHKKFGKEFEKQRLARKILERIDNNVIDKIFDAITPKILSEISDKDDFDFHAISIVKLLGMQKSLNVTQNIIRAEIKRLLTR